MVFSGEKLHVDSCRQQLRHGHQWKDCEESLLTIWIQTQIALRLWEHKLSFISLSLALSSSPSWGHQVIIEMVMTTATPMHKRKTIKPNQMKFKVAFQKASSCLLSLNQKIYVISKGITPIFSLLLQSIWSSIRPMHCLHSRKHFI